MLTQVFHILGVHKMRHNEIVNIEVSVDYAEGVIGICKVVYNHFVKHFDRVNLRKKHIENLQFLVTRDQYAYFLISPFSYEEIKQIAWECDNFKSLRLDGVKKKIEGVLGGDESGFYAFYVGVSCKQKISEVF